MTGLSLHQVELTGTETGTVMGLLAGVAAVPEVESFGGLVATGHLGKLALISYSIGTKLLPGDVSKAGGSPFFHPLHCLRGMLFAEWTISVKLFWHLHLTSSLNLHYGR